MPEIEKVRLAGAVPMIARSHLQEQLRRADPDFTRQLETWGFMALEVPGIGALTHEVYAAFSGARDSATRDLSDFVYSSVPQFATGGNHGYFPYGSEIPRLSGGVADPKEFVHISGAMINDDPPGAGDLLKAFPAMNSPAQALFDVGFDIATHFGSFILRYLGQADQKLSLSRESSILRVIRYEINESTRVLAHEHSGIQMLGVQFPPSSAGLQYVLNNGQWVEPVLHDNDIVLCNIGRMLSYASGDAVRPSTHRVFADGNAVGTRFSTVLFVHPDHSSGKWRRNSQGSVEVNGTWGDFVEERARGLGL
jgi:isopenicillin N synthase-like dioxygenase